MNLSLSRKISEIFFHTFLLFSRKALRRAMPFFLSKKAKNTEGPLFAKNPSLFLDLNKIK
jgi:hypothetical protein